MNIDFDAVLFKHFLRVTCDQFLSSFNEHSCYNFFQIRSFSNITSLGKSFLPPPPRQPCIQVM